MSDLVFDVCGQTFIHSSARLQCWTQDTGHTALGTLVSGPRLTMLSTAHSPPTLPSHLRISPNNRVYLRYYEPNVCVDISHSLETMILITLLITDQTNMLIVLWLAFYHHQSETQTRCRHQTGTGGGSNSLDNVIWPENNIYIYLRKFVCHHIILSPV